MGGNIHTQRQKICIKGEFSENVRAKKSPILLPNARKRVFAVASAYSVVGSLSIPSFCVCIFDTFAPFRAAFSRFFPLYSYCEKLSISFSEKRKTMTEYGKNTPRLLSKGIFFVIYALKSFGIFLVLCAFIRCRGVVAADILRRNVLIRLCARTCGDQLTDNNVFL